MLPEALPVNRTFVTQILRILSVVWRSRGRNNNRKAVTTESSCKITKHHTVCRIYNNGKESTRMKKYLVLENGMTFEGEAFGADKEAVAEIVFTTAMTGYVETLTDQSYAGQAVVQTFPLIGNYGVMYEDFESSSVAVSAYIVREYCKTPSNFRCEGDIDGFLKKYGIPGICGIDTRALTRVLREHGTMNGMIADDLSHADPEEIKAYRIVRPVDRVSRTAERIVNPDGKYPVALLDFGVKENIIRSLAVRDCAVHVLPFDTTAEKIISMNVAGLFLTNGPGDPTDNVEVIANIRKLCGTGLPIMGICLGHQLLALANGFRTRKLKYGHRGTNHPVKDLKRGRTYISTQNHGYAVVGESVDRDIADELFVNVNDRTNEGLVYKKIPAFSAQFHPEACGGPTDTSFLFDDFINMMKGGAE